MSKQYKKMQKKLYPQQEDPHAKEKEKIGKDYLLMTIICFTFVVTIVGWSQFDNLNRAMYPLLTLSLLLTYLCRPANVSAPVRASLTRAILGPLGLAVAMFLIAMYYQFFG